MIRKLFYLFIFFAPFTSFLAVSAWLRIPIVINLVLCLFVVIGLTQKGVLKKPWIQREDLVLLCFLFAVFVSFLFGFKEKRSVNHLLAYTNAILFFFFLSKLVIRQLSMNSKEISRVIYYSFVVCSILIISDFIGKNYLGVSLRNAFSTVDGKISNMDYFIRFGFYRVGGVAEEPGTMALFYNIYFGVSCYYLKIRQKKSRLYLASILFVISHFAMMSNAGIVLPVLAILMIFLFNKIEKLSITKNQLFYGIMLFVGSLIGAVAIFYFDVANTSQIAEEFLNKIFFNEDQSYSSSGQRIKQWSRALHNFVQHPILGWGPGFGVDQDQEGYLSVYLTILADIGILGFLLYLSYLEGLVKKVVKLPIDIRNFILFSLITSLLHLVIVSDFYHAPIWILFVLIQLLYNEQKSLTA